MCWFYQASCHVLSFSHIYPTNNDIAMYFLLLYHPSFSIHQQPKGQPQSALGDIIFRLMNYLGSARSLKLVIRLPFPRCSSSFTHALFLSLAPISDFIILLCLPVCLNLGRVFIFAVSTCPTLSEVNAKWLIKNAIFPGLPDGLGINEVSKVRVIMIQSVAMFNRSVSI